MPAKIGGNSDLTMVANPVKYTSVKVCPKFSQFITITAAVAMMPTMIAGHFLQMRNRTRKKPTRMLK